VIRFLLRRVGWSLVVLWFVLSAAFVITSLLPADPVRAMLGPHADPETVAQVRKNLALDRPVAEQYVRYVGRVLDGDLGVSYRLGQPVTEIIGAHVWPTAQLALATIVLQLLLGVPLGWLAASRRNRWPDGVAQVVALLGQSAPTFFLGPFFAYAIAYGTGLFPISGYGVGGLLDRLHHLFLPALTLAVGGVATYARLLRSEMIEALGEDYVRTARAKGLSRWAVEGRHALRNALLPLVTVVALDLGALMGGAIVTEYVFSWPGVGREAVNGILNLDLPVILGVVLVAAVAIVVINLLVDILYAWLDPRVRLE
jgi:peptide/nickel transport system permease protein